MRGKVPRLTVHDVARGITPAYAGKSSHNRSDISIDWDHPRLCGEKSNGTFVMPRTPGSPPPMRGKVSRTGFSRLQVGITPAYAGKRRRL